MSDPKIEEMRELLNMRKAILLAFLFAAPAPAAMAGNVSTGNWCLEASDTFNRTVCSSEIWGAAEAASDLDLLCAPSRVTLDQLYQMTLQYTRRHPDKRHLSIHTLGLSAAFEAGWGCKAAPATLEAPGVY